MTVAGAARASRSVELSVAALCWLALGVAFVATRLAFALSAPVGGPELDALSGAWQAASGTADSRFVPTLFQGISALLFQGFDSELAPRLVLVAASVSVPLLLWRLRPELGEGGALAALLLLTFDAPAVLLGASASAMGLDIPIALAVFAAARSPRLPGWAWAIIGALAATAGPLPLVFALGIGAVRLAGQDYPGRAALIGGCAGAAAGIAAASLRFGLGWDGLRVPPLDLFAASFDADWSTESTAALVGLYSWPVLLIGLAAAGWLVLDRSGGRRIPSHGVEAAAAGGLAMGWLVASATSYSAVPLAAVAVPAALLGGPLIARAAGAVTGADWSLARYLLPVAALALAIVTAFLLEWAPKGEVGPVDEAFLAAGMGVAALAALGFCGWHPASRPVLLAPLGAVLMLPMFSNAFAVATGAPNEPMPSPVSAAQARTLRDIATETRERSGGLIVIHASFADAVTWPFRDSGEIVLATRVPPDATFVIWPVDDDAPEGFDVLDGSWALLGERAGPDGDFLDYLRWYANRNTLNADHLAVAVYVRESE